MVPTQFQEKCYWQAFGVSVAGAQNLSRHLPKEDALHWLPVSGRGRRIALAVADGHGHSRFFRSGTGAHFAVHVTTEALREFASEFARETDASVILHWANEELPSQITERWRDEVEVDLVKNPLTAQEIHILTTEFSQYPERLARYMPYGSTAIGVGFTDHFLVALQLGDGNISLLDKAGEASFLFDPDAQLDASSISMADAPFRFRSRVIALHENTPALVAVNTDGFRNAFTSSQSYLTEASDFLQKMRKDGMLRVLQRLQRWATEQAGAPPGEDISVAFAYLLEDYHAHQHLRRRLV